MIRRTENPNSKDYHNYGGKGIKICEEWRTDYYVFERWALSHGYADHLTIDRKDNSKGYYPENCRWATRQEQSDNKTDSVRVEYNGEFVTISQLSSMTGVSRFILATRIEKYDWDIERAINEPVHHVKKEITHAGKTQSIHKWAQELGIPYATLKQRFKCGWEPSRALTGGAF
jgi:hypothetical protein